MLTSTEMPDGMYAPQRRQILQSWPAGATRQSEGAR
jgi:hypothetical protein